MSDSYCRYCGLRASIEPPAGCPRHPRPKSQVERLEDRVEALERTVNILVNIIDPEFQYRDK